MIKRTSLAVLALSLFCCVPTFGNEDAKKAMASVPDDAMAFLCIPNLATLDADIQQLIKDLKLSAMIPPPMQSLVTNLKMNLPMLAGIDETGPICLVVMPFTVPAEIQSKIALILPTANPQAMITTLGGQAEENGVWPISFMGQSQFTIVKEKSLILAQSAETAKAIAQSKSDLTTKLNPEELNAFANLDTILWVHTKQALSIFKPQIDGMMAMMQAQEGGPLAQKQADMTKSQIDTFVLGVKSIMIGISLDNAGLGIHTAIAANPGTTLASEMVLANTKESLLTGLPLGKYILASGQQVHPDQAKAAIKQLDAYLAMASDIEGVTQEKLTELKEIMNHLMLSLKSYALTLEALPPSDQGLAGATLIIRTDDAAKYVTQSNQLIALGLEMLNAAAKNVDEELEELTQAIVHAPKAEAGPAGPIAQIRLDLTKIDDEDLEESLKIVGKEGIVARIAAVDNKNVIVTIGGGKPYFDRAIAAAKSHQSPMANDVGIKKVAPHMPASRAQVVYIALDHGMALVNNIKLAVDGEPLPMPVPTVDAPIALTTSGSTNRIQIDLLFPTDLLKAATNMGMAMSGMGPPPAAPTAKPESNETQTID